jgi:uncharacterized cupin superfamily protein
VAERPVVRAAAREAELVAEPLDPARVLDGDPRPAAFVIASSADGAESGVWRCTPGRFRDIESDETFVVLEGRATIEFEGGRVEVGPGDVCVLAAGTETVWTVRETLLKGYELAADTALTRVS